MAKLNMEQDLPILLVLGGSKGARSINQATLTILTVLLQNWQVIHITGKMEWEEVNARRMSLPVPIQTRYHTYPYLYEEMGAALRCADIVLSRAGASCLGEYPLFGLPAILVPYPYAWRYQKVNADYLVKHQAAVLLEDNQLTTALYPTIETLAQDKLKLSNMRQAMRSLSQPQAANNLANLIRQLASQKGVASC
jgi:UDP-N-acetylglucosamine:LPS N-acetylglucosamine transferase